MKKFSLALLGIVAILAFCNTPNENKAKTRSASFNFKRIQQKAATALSFCKNKNYNTGLCILIDMSLHSGKKRAFIYDFKKDTIIASGLCAHGCGDYPWGGDNTKESPKFSNTPDSHCSSLGKYKIGKRGYSQWGINVNYLLHGLEKTNSNAVKRQIVLHSWSDVSEEEVHPDGTPEGWGCPAVANGFMKILDGKLKDTNKPVLLWVFN